jgi:hypothetical protein
MTDRRPDPEQERARIREQLPAQSDEREEEEARDEASLAPPGHLGERMLEGERSERRG